MLGGFTSTQIRKKQMGIFVMLISRIKIYPSYIHEYIKLSFYWKNTKMEK
jgi:hypothetical protein